MAQIIGLKKLLGKLEARQAQAAADDGAAVIVGYTQEYAIYVHEDLEAFHPVGQAKYLEQPYRQMLPELKRIIAKAKAAGMPLIQSLLLAGLRLQRESQLLVPVDTGALKNSAFTRKE